MFPRDNGPIDMSVEPDGTGSASFDWPRVLGLLTRGFEHNLRDALGYDVAVIGVRFVDADGRAITGPQPAGVTLVGFTKHH